jgi:hypothetical protein
MGSREWEESVRHHFQGFFKNAGGRYKRIRRRPKGKTLEEHYQLQAEKLQKLENMSINGKIDLYYGDETHVCNEGYVPYGWQFPDEEVCFLTEKAYKFNCFGFINRNSLCRWKVTQENIDTAFVVDFLDKFSFEIQRTTFLVSDNARIHKTKAIKERIPYRQRRGLFLYLIIPRDSWLSEYSPAYS